MTYAVLIILTLMAPGQVTVEQREYPTMDQCERVMADLDLDLHANLAAKCVATKNI